MNRIRKLRAPASALLLAATVAGCDSAYEDLFFDPERAPNARIEYLFTQVLTGAELHIGYWEAYYRIYRNMSRWAQLTGTVNDDRMMNIDGSQWGDYWRQYYAERSMYVKEMEAIHDTLPTEVKAAYDVYIHLGRIIHAYQTAEITDLWGDMPYAEAFTARRPEGERNLFPKYDSQESIYDAVLQQLQDASDALRNSSLVVHAALPTQDVFLGGDLNLWQRFANSVRLRLGMRLSEVAPGKARAVVQEILTGGYPLVDVNAQNIIWRTTPNRGGDDRGLPTRESPQLAYAPKVMLDLMNTANDPRRPVLFATNAAGDFVGLPSSPDEQPAEVTREVFAYLNPPLFERHPTYPGAIITAAEVSFLKAEAYQRGWAAGDAAAAHRRALEQSVEYYYDLYNSNPNATPMPRPDPAAVQAFATSSSAAYDGTLRSIAVQKWIHLGVNQPYDAWAELRRLDFPELPPDRFGGRVLERTTRITYPSSELSNNRESYAAVQGKDAPTTRVWWDVR
jgi:hypothetical protein